MSSPFPLLRLPRLVLFDVFKSLSIGEKIKLSFCSKKVSTQINNARLYSQKVNVQLNCLRQKISVYTENYKNSFEISIYSDSWRSHNSNTDQFSIACCTARVISISKGVQICWKNHQEGFLYVTQHLLKMFQCTISTKSHCYGSDFFHPTISMLFDRQVEFKRLTICLNGSKDQSLFWNQISSNFGLVEYFRIESVADPAFIPVFNSWPQKIYIIRSDWFTLESLLACTCTTITLWDSLLGTKDLDVILRKWKAGGFANLEWMKIQSRNIENNETTILGMNLMELRGMVIQTDDGSKKATINTDYGRIEMSVISI
ncbi:hypothetical protein CRE_22014 [Caenorhabditis remanei]|uniref:F-box domain-containing protein n=1 Tax=Caenorhabditis remanei TaxID=31234 RepID=E3N3E0_CAERE|nr:hypothetical protein CRE_22014 [Caenorhabditis remanei]